MRQLLVPLLVMACLAMFLLPALRPGYPIQEGFPVDVLAPTASIRIVAGVSTAGRGDTIRYTAWLNLSGGGFLPRTWVNFSLDSSLAPDTSGTLTPSGCTRVQNLSWQCNGLRAGTSTWSLGGRVSDAAPVAEYVVSAVVATTCSSTSCDPPLQDSASVWIAGVNVALLITSDPSSAVQAGDRVRFLVHASNPSENMTAHNITLAVAVDADLVLDPGVDLTPTVERLTSGSEFVLNFTALVPPGRDPGSTVGARATLTYEDFNYHPIGPMSQELRLTVRASAVTTPENLTAALAVGLLAVLGVVAALLLTGQRRIRIDEVFLIHRSGVLLAHRSRESALKKDDELVASMLVAVQDFVRDSFRSEGMLDEFRFGGRRAAIVRGRDVLLAALLSRGDVTYLVPQLRGALDALEAAHGPALARWDGRMSGLDRVDPILDTLVSGGYRAGEQWRDRFGKKREGPRPGA